MSDDGGMVSHAARYCDSTLYGTLKTDLPTIFFARDTGGFSASVLLYYQSVVSAAWSMGAQTHGSSSGGDDERCGECGVAGVVECH